MKLSLKREIWHCDLPASEPLDYLNPETDLSLFFCISLCSDKTLCAVFVLLLQGQTSDLSLQLLKKKNVSFPLFLHLVCCVTALA